MTTLTAHRTLARLASVGLVACLSVAAVAPAATATPSDPSPGRSAEAKQHLSRVSEAFATEDTVSVIVSLCDDPTVAKGPAKDAHFDRQQAKVLDRIGRDKAHGVKALPGAPFVSLAVTRSQADALAAMPEVADMVVDGVTVGNGMSSYGGANGQQLTKGWDISQINATWTNENGYTGSGQYVAIIDSGVDSANTYLAGRVVNEACFATNPNKTGACNNGGVWQYSTAKAGVAGSARRTGCTFNYYDCAHGTHVAQTAAGSYGVARGAKIVAIRTGHKEWSAEDNAYRVLHSNSDVLNALWYVYKVLPANGIVVAGVNMSIGSVDTYSTTCDANVPDVTSYITKLRNDYQIPTVISSGNGSSSTRLRAARVPRHAPPSGRGKSRPVAARHRNWRARRRRRGQRPIGPGCWIERSAARTLPPPFRCAMVSCATTRRVRVHAPSRVCRAG